eukprot:Clim_evm28s218 gene=Clim_evmTU28s218
MSTISAKVAKVGDLAPNTMKEVEVGDYKALLINDNGEYRALGHKCSHYGAPLAKGVLSAGRVRCPWHGACFSAKTGDIEDFPGNECVEKFAVKVEGDDVVVSGEKASFERALRTAVHAAGDGSDERAFVIVGGGPGGCIAAETLRKGGFQGKVIMLTQEANLPYDRVKLSKAMNIDVEKITLRDQTFWDEIGVEVRTGAEVTELDPASKTIKLADGSSLTYDGCLVATGGKPRVLPIGGTDGCSVYTLRSPADASKLWAEAEGKKVAILGASFIGMESASALHKHAAEVHVIGLEKTPFENILGQTVGASIQKLHEENGIKFHLSKAVDVIHRTDGKICSVKLKDGSEVPADVVLMGVGVVPNTGFVKATGGVEIGKDGGITVSAGMKAADGLWCSGDIARYPFHLENGAPVRIEHFQIAEKSASIAAKDFLGKEGAVMQSVPYFWTVQYGKSFRYTGHGVGFDDIVYEGSVEEGKWAAFYAKQGKIIAVASLGYDPMVSRCAELFGLGLMPTAEAVKAGGVDWAALDKQIAAAGKVSSSL